MTGSNQKCTNTGHAEHVVDSQLICQEEAIQNNARYYSYVNAEKTCFCLHHLLTLMIMVATMKIGDIA